MSDTPGLALSPDEELLRDTARAFAFDRSPVSEMRRLRDANDALGFSRPLWEEMAALGWAGLPFPASVGGGEAGCFAAGLVAEELGRTLAPTPLLATILAGTCLAGPSAAAIGSPLAEKVLAEVVAGRRLVALAADGPCGAEPSAAGVRLSGRKTFVIDGGAADYLIVSAELAEGTALVLLDAGAPGLDRSSTRLVDSRRYATVALEGVEHGEDAILADASGGTALLAVALDRGTAILSAEMVGMMSAALDMTVKHLKERRQFGVPIGSFQALQHRAARMYVAVELARSVVYDALRALDAGADDASLRVSAAKARANGALRLVTSEAIQMHGGMGITDEADIGLYLKRARVAEALLGDTPFHRRRFAALSGF